MPPSKDPCWWSRGCQMPSPSIPISSQGPGVQHSSNQPSVGTWGYVKKYPRSFISTRHRIIQYNIWSLEIGFSCSHCLVLLVLMDRLQAVLWTDDYWVSLVKLIKEGSQGIFPKCVLWAQDFLALSLWIGVKCHEEISCYSHSLGSSHILNSSAAAFWTDVSPKKPPTNIYEKQDFGVLWEKFPSDEYN